MAGALAAAAAAAGLGFRAPEQQRNCSAYQEGLGVAKGSSSSSSAPLETPLWNWN